MLLSEVSGSSFLAREVVEAARGNRHFESGRWFDVASVVSALFTYKMNIFGGKSVKRKKESKLVKAFKIKFQFYYTK